MLHKRAFALGSIMGQVEQSLQEIGLTSNIQQGNERDRGRIIKRLRVTLPGDQAGSEKKRQRPAKYEYQLGILECQVHKEERRELIHYILLVRIAVPHQLVKNQDSQEQEQCQCSVILHELA